MTLSEWRKGKDRTAWMAAALQSEEFQTLLEMLENEHPKNNRDPINSAEMELGRIYGYDLFKTNLKAAALHVPLQEPIESTFEPAELSEQK